MLYKQDYCWIAGLWNLTKYLLRGLSKTSERKLCLPFQEAWIKNLQTGHRQFSSRDNSIGFTLEIEMDLEYLLLQHEELDKELRKSGSNDDTRTKRRSHHDDADRWEESEITIYLYRNEMRMKLRMRIEMRRSKSQDWMKTYKTTTRDNTSFFLNVSTRHVTFYGWKETDKSVSVAYGKASMDIWKLIDSNRKLLLEYSSTFTTMMDTRGFIRIIGNSG